MCAVTYRLVRLTHLKKLLIALYELFWAAAAGSAHLCNEPEADIHGAFKAVSIGPRLH